MKIGPLESKPAPSPAPAERKAGVGTPLPPVAVEPSAKVNLSPAAAGIAEATDPTFDSAKVERIAKAIRDGQFKPDAEAIADKLIINAEELLGRRFS
jgi:negative regulator of flagellin synthesis FlgM